MSGGGDKLARIRRIARRSAPGPAFALSDEPAWRRVQIRFIATGLFFVLATAALVIRRFQMLGNTASVVAVIAGVAVVVVAPGVFLWRSRTAPAVDGGDREEDLLGSEVQRRLQAGQLSPQDLVFEDRRWVTFLESFRFGEDASVRQGKLDQVQRLRMGVLIAAGVVVAVGIFVMLANFGDFVGWLLLDT
ncbi:MAG TPA: hypothetical protein VFA20_01590 [Myxococcaceae bacterium]|nr:hypothetical protein [Myxococcaceae bacterium]